MGKPVWLKLKEGLCGVANPMPDGGATPIAGPSGQSQQISDSQGSAAGSSMSRDAASAKAISPAVIKQPDPAVVDLPGPPVVKQQGRTLFPQPSLAPQPASRNEPLLQETAAMVRKELEDDAKPERSPSPRVLSSPWGSLAAPL